MNRMEIFRKHFPADDPNYGDAMIDSAEVIDGEYLSGTFDWYLDECGYKPEDIGVSPGAVKYREEQTAYLKAQEGKELMDPGKEVSTQVVASVVEQIMRPMLESMGSLMKRMSEAVEHIATAQDVMRNRLEALEKESRLNTPVTDTQARYLAAAAKDKAVDILSRKGVTDKKAVTKLAGMIRKAVLQRYGKGSLREIPRCEYGVAMSQIESWNKATEVARIVFEARARQEEENIHETAGT